MNDYKEKSKTKKGQENLLPSTNLLCKSSQARDTPVVIIKQKCFLLEQV